MILNGIVILIAENLLVELLQDEKPVQITSKCGKLFEITVLKVV